MTHPPSSFLPPMPRTSSFHSLSCSVYKYSCNTSVFSCFFPRTNKQTSEFNCEITPPQTYIICHFPSSRVADDRARKEAEEREERAKITLARTDQKTMEQLPSSGQFAKMARPNAPSQKSGQTQGQPVEKGKEQGQNEKSLG
jgi:hypothetical protein